ncbi:MAG: alpha/beta hydrolase [Oricola sp.]
MIEDVRGRIDYHEQGTGPVIVLLPGSCSTGAAWRPVIAAWNGQFRCVTTSLLGYGGTAERRTGSDRSMDREAEVVEAVIRKAGGNVHLVGHSFGGMVALAVALRGRAALASLTVIEAPIGEFLGEVGEDRHYDAFQRMRNAYFAAYEAGDPEAIAIMFDFYSGAGAFASLPRQVRDYAVATTPVNIMDWQSAYASGLSMAALAAVDIPVLVLRGGASHPAMQCANALLFRAMGNVALATVDGAAHFMLATHAREVAGFIARHARGVETSPAALAHPARRERQSPDRAAAS